MSAELRASILGAVQDLAIDLVYYDRKGDEALPLDAIEQAIQDGVISVDDMAAQFRSALVEHLGDG